MAAMVDPTQPGTTLARHTSFLTEDEIDDMVAMATFEALAVAMDVGDRSQPVAEMIHHAGRCADRMLRAVVAAHPGRASDISSLYGALFQSKHAALVHGTYQLQ